MRFALVFPLLALAVYADTYSPPSAYYAGTVGLNGTALDTVLHSAIKGQTVRTYDQLRLDLAVTDRDPVFPAPVGQPLAVTNILLLHSVGWSGYSRSGVWDAGATWNREHTWPDSRGIGQPDQGPDFSDLHHIRAINPSANNSRNNNYFDVGGTLGPVTQAPQARRTSTTWEPPDVDKGWVARACLYMATRYDGTETDTTDLILVETPPSVTTSNPPQMGRLSTLLLWNRLHPPTEWERRRNQTIFDTYQRNRNPFIDYPEFADAIYETRETLLSWRYWHFTLAELESAASSGDTADPDGDGIVNLLEYALGGNPKSGDTTILPRMYTDAGKTYFQYRRQRTKELSALTYTLERTDNLAGTWATAPAYPETSYVFEGYLDVVSVEVPPGFYRIKVGRASL